MKNCKWISHKNAGACDNATYIFKKSFCLDSVKSSTIEVSAQARYKLYINGAFVSCGPCKGTREKTYFDCVDVTSYLNVGENEIFVMGDNRNNSEDSRSIGTISEDAVLGKVILRFYPFDKFGPVN